MQQVPTDLMIPFDPQRSPGAQWLQLATAGGFECGPAPTEAQPLSDEVVVRADMEWPPVFIPTTGGRLLVGVNGDVFAIPDRESSRELLGELQAGMEGRVGELVERFGASVGASLVRETLDALHRARGLAIVAP